MLDGTDRATFFALRLLRDTVDQATKPVIIWAGAGVSKWCGYLDWQETANELHAEYLRLENAYDRTLASASLKSQDYPRLFECCHSANDKRYHRKLVSLFGPRPVTPVYSHFLNIVAQIAPLFVITTNVDESLEHNLPGTTTVQRSNLERCLDLLDGGVPFVTKLHGSVSFVESVVFTSTDYAGLFADGKYLHILQSLFMRATVVFVGYSLRDKYVLDLLMANANSRPLFGDGPHFAVKSSDTPGLPESIQMIRYTPEPHTDHRSSIVVLDIIRSVRTDGRLWFSAEEGAASKHIRRTSAYFITDITPPGVWTSSQTLTLTRKDGSSFSAIVGQGFVDAELPERTSPALHDLTVGLISFDTVYVNLSCLAKLHQLLGADLFWTLVKADALRFIRFESEPVMCFASVDAVAGGDIGVAGRSDLEGNPTSTDEEIRRQLHSVPGREGEAERLFTLLKSRTLLFDDKRFNIASLTRGALLHPAIQGLLGVSGAVLPTSIPRWVVFPVLRLAHTIMAGCACENFTIPATKVGFGSEVLVGAAFAVAAERDWAENVASYVLTGRFNTELGGFVAANPGIFTEILSFRETQAGIDLRREILDELALHAGSEFVASVNAGLRRIIPTSVMDSARDQLSGLLVGCSENYSVVPAVWTNVRNSDSITKLWRSRSGRILQEHCSTNRIGEYDLCPCGSGEKLRFCCARAVRE